MLCEYGTEAAYVGRRHTVQDLHGQLMHADDYVGDRHLLLVGHNSFKILNGQAYCVRLCKQSPKKKLCCHD